MKEIWKNVPGYEGKYMISNLGRVYSCARWAITKGEAMQWRKGRILKSIEDKHYNYVNLCANGKRAKTSVHGLVASAFITKLYDNLEINHKDGNKRNNTVNNLEWCTHSDNIRHADRTGLRKMPKGERCVASKLTRTQVLEIRKLNEFLAQSMISEMYDIAPSTVSYIVNNKTWSHI